MDKTRLRAALAVLLGGLWFAASATQAMAGGLAVNEASARLTGTGYAGTAALAEDASMAWYNPAGLTRMEGGSAVSRAASFNWIRPSRSPRRAPGGRVV